MHAHGILNIIITYNTIIAQSIHAHTNQSKIGPKISKNRPITYYWQEHSSTLLLSLRLNPQKAPMALDLQKV